MAVRKIPELFVAFHGQQSVPRFFGQPQGETEFAARGENLSVHIGGHRAEAIFELDVAGRHDPGFREDQKAFESA